MRRCSQETWRQDAAGAPSRATAGLVDLLGENPFWTVRGVAQRLGIAYTTALRAIRRLEEDAVLTVASGGKRDRVYCARAILDILEEPARLEPFSPA